VLPDQGYHTLQGAVMNRYEATREWLSVREIWRCLEKKKCSIAAVSTLILTWSHLGLNPRNRCMNAWATWNTLRSTQRIFFKSEWGEFGEQLSSYFNFRFDWSSLTTILPEDFHVFLRKSCWREQRSEQEFQGKMKRSFYVHCNAPISFQFLT
jgi:hypothetical protein